MAPGKRVPSPVVSEASSGYSTPRGVPPDPNEKAAVAEREKPARAGTDKVSRSGGNPGANIWFLWSTPIQMLPRRGSICGEIDLGFVLNSTPGWTVSRETGGC